MHADKDIILLKQEFRRFAFVMWGMIGFAGISLGLLWERQAALQWIVVTGLLWSMVDYQVRNRLSLNRPPSSAGLHSTLGPANRLTILRGGLIAATGGFLFLDWPPGILVWLPGCLYTLAAILDRIDGFVARKTGQISLLGVELDTLFDALGLAVAPLLAVWYGQVHWSYLLFSIAYYLFQWGIYLRGRKGLPVHDLPPNIVRRAWAGFQMGFISVVLFPVFTPPITRVAGVAFVIPVLIGFLIDWLVVSGGINRNESITARRFNAWERLLQRFLLPVQRVTAVVLVVTITGLSSNPVSLFVLVMAICMLTGLAGRAAALGLIIVAVVHYQRYALDHAGTMLVIMLVWIMLLGTGSFSLWKPDERWINRYDGGP